LELLKAIILGIVQGLTVFLPVSTSGHLVLVSEILKFKTGGLAFEVFVHFGTLLAVLVVFRKDIWDMIRFLPGLPAFIANRCKIQTESDKSRALALYIIIGTIPAGVLGLLFEKQLEHAFSNPRLVLVTLFVTGLIMLSSRFPVERLPFMNAFHSVLIGLAQAFSIIPGISRSGSTIVTALWLGINRELAARFSFLLSVPVILGASILKFMDLLHAPPSGEHLLILLAATIAAAVSGYIAIIWLLDIIRKHKLEWFGVYCIIVSVAGLVILFLQ